MARLWQTQDIGRPSWVWAGEDVLVMQSGGVMIGFEPESGEQLWKLRRPEGVSGICSVSESPNQEGIVGVVFNHLAESVKRGCKTVGAVDISDGKVLWTEQVGTEGVRAISLGATVLSATLWESGELHRFAAESGEALRTVGEAGSEIADTWHNGTLVGVGDERTKSFTLYDSEAGKRMWSSPPGTELRRIVASDPVTLEVRTEGEVSLRTFEDGKDDHTLVSGKKIYTSGIGFEGDRHPQQGGGRTVLDEGFTPQFVRGSVLVTHFDAQDAAVPSGDYDDHYAYDLDSGELLWELQDEEISLFAVRPDALLASSQESGGDGRTRLLSISLHEGKQEKLGTLAAAQDGDASRPFAADKERIYVQQGDMVAAYRLP